LGILLLERCTGPKSSIRDPWTWMLMVLVLFARPVGILFVAPCLLHLLRREQLVGGGAIAMAALGLLCVLFLLPMDMETVVEPILRGEVMYGISRWELPTMDEPPRTLIGAHWALIQEVGPYEWSRLFAQKAFHCFVLTRPYYSATHNMVLLLHYAVYPFAVLAILRRTEPAVRSALLVLLLHVAVIAMTYTEWNSRFMTPLWPVLLLLGATGGQWIVHRSRMAGSIT
ncbi:MAG: hypothetical protein KDB88_00225, partial [Flavobacteriales bacterium]|nr:hypothetical protein [Flavobacteriales bacterium]